MNNYSPCEWSRTASSLRLERRLPPASTKRLEAHLRDCAECREFDHDMVELRERISFMPHESAPPDLAAKVRERALLGRRNWFLSSATAQRAAGVLVTAFSLFAAYSLGKIAGEPETRTYVFEVPFHSPIVASGPSDPAVLDSPIVDEGSSPRDLNDTAPEALDESRRIRRAVRAVLTDLAVIDKIPEPQRKPLIQSQLHHFGLDAWAAGLNAEDAPRATKAENDLAAVVREIDTALDSEPSALLDMKSDHRITGLFATLGAIEPPAGEASVPRRQRTIDLSSFASALSPRDLSALEDLLDFKVSVVEGEIGTAIDNATQREGVAVALDASSFAPILRANIASAVAAAGSPPVEPKGGSKNAGRSSLSLDSLPNAKVRIGNGYRSTVVTVEVPVDEEQ